MSNPTGSRRRFGPARLPGPALALAACAVLGAPPLLAADAAGGGKEKGKGGQSESAKTAAAPAADEIKVEVSVPPHWPGLGYAPVRFHTPAAANLPLEIRVESAAGPFTDDPPFSARRRVGVGVGAAQAGAGNMDDTKGANDADGVVRSPREWLLPHPAARKRPASFKAEVPVEASLADARDGRPLWRGERGFTASPAPPDSRFQRSRRAADNETVLDFSDPTFAPPASWAYYAGMYGIVRLPVERLRALTPEQTRALGFWLRWAGGRLRLELPAGLDFPEAESLLAESLGLPLQGHAFLPQANGARRYPVHEGTLVLVPAPAKSGDDDKGDTSKESKESKEAKAPKASDTSEAGGDQETIRAAFPGFVGGFFPWKADGENDVFAPMFRDLRPGLSLFALGLALAVFALVLGPVNYGLLRRRRRRLWFFLTTPLLALLGSGAIVGLSALADGVSTRRVETVLLAVHEDAAPDAADNARLFAARTVRSGFLTPEIRFAENTLVYPLREAKARPDAPDGLPAAGPESDLEYEARRRPYVVDFTDGVRLADGWIEARGRSGLLSVEALSAEPGLAFEYRDDGSVWIRNRLPVALLRHALRLPDGGVHVGRRLDAGEARFVAQRVDRPRAPTPDVLFRRHRDGTRSLASTVVAIDLRDATGLEPSDAVRVVAECEAPPIVPKDGGLGGSLEKGRYFYVQCADPYRADAEVWPAPAPPQSRTPKPSKAQPGAASKNNPGK